MELRNQALRSLTDTTGKWKHLSLVSTACLPYMPHVAAPALTGMLFTALTVNGNTSLRCLRHFYGTCPSHCPSSVWGAFGYMATSELHKPKCQKISDFRYRCGESPSFSNRFVNSVIWSYGCTPFGVYGRFGGGGVGEWYLPKLFG